MHPSIATPATAAELIARDDVDAVLVLTSMNEHAELAQAALRGGQTRAGRKADGDRTSPPRVSCCRSARARRGFWSALRTSCCRRRTGPCMPTCTREKSARSCWLARVTDGPDRGGEHGSIVRVAGRCSISRVYNLKSLCGFMGPVRRVCAMVGTAIPRRMSEGVEIDVQADDNAQVLLDFGESRFACITTGFTMQKYRSPAIELYGTDGVLQMLGDDWAPQGFERWTKERELWEVHRGKRAAVAVDRRLAAPRRVRCRRNAARQPARTRPALSGGHAGGANFGARRSGTYRSNPDFRRSITGTCRRAPDNHRRKHDPRTT